VDGAFHQDHPMSYNN